MTEEELKQRIDAMLSERDRNVARILLEHTLPGMQKYYKEKVEELRQQLFEEKTEKLNHYEIAITICEWKDVRRFEDVLFVMDSSDEQQKEYVEKEDAIYFPVWIAADEMEIRQYVKDGIKGILHTEKEEWEVHFSVIKNDTYCNILQQCRNAFAGNGVYWKEVNEAYLHKFYYLKVSLDSACEDVEFIGYSVDNKALEEKICRNRIPLWNIRNMTLSANDFPVMQEDHVYYRYDFRLPEKVEMLFDKTDCETGYGIRYQDRYSFFSRDNKKRHFHVWQIHANDFSKTDSQYDVLTNGVKKALWSNQGHSRMVHSDFELTRFLKTLTISERIAYEGCQIVQEYDEICDYVVAREPIDALPLQKERSYLELMLHNISLPYYLYRDSLRFIVNLVQSEFREYKVIAKCIFESGNRQYEGEQR